MKTKININRYTLGSGQGITLEVCDDCGSVVYETRQHEAWHAGQVKGN